MTVIRIAVRLWCERLQAKQRAPAGAALSKIPRGRSIEGFPAEINDLVVDPTRQASKVGMLAFGACIGICVAIQLRQQGPGQQGHNRDEQWEVHVLSPVCCDLTNGLLTPVHRDWFHFGTLFSAEVLNCLTPRATNGPASDEGWVQPM
jgi:hypothetical protein